MTNGPVTPVLRYSKVRSVAATRSPPLACNTEVDSVIFSTLALLCCSSLPASTPQGPAKSPTAAAEQLGLADKSSEPASSSNSNLAKPDAPTAKLNVLANGDADPSGEPVASVTPAPVHAVIKPVTPESYETSRKRKIWYGLLAVNHGAAAFDAWSTRRAIGGGYGTERDPLERPFANSGAIYATTQVVPVLMDFVGHHMMRSEHPTIRKFWWIPQAACAGLSLGAGVHNYRLVH
jgi:hypothetical protein